MSSLLVIANKALRKIGVKEINSLEQQGRAAERCNAAVEDIVREVLSAYPWSHAMVWTTLAPLADAPDFGYDYAYQLPSDCDRLIDLRSTKSLETKPETFERVRGKIIYTNATPCYVRYIVYDKADLRLADKSFIDACALKLAMEICIALSKANLMDSLNRAYQLALDRAELDDASMVRPTQPDINRTNSILAARNYPYTEDS